MTSRRNKLQCRRAGRQRSATYRFMTAAAAAATASYFSLAFFLENPTRLQFAQAYISTGLPAHVHRAYLRKLTDDICSTDPGSLTPQEVSNTSMLMSAWASAPKKLRESGKERAMKVENLLKRIIDERRAGNTEAIARTEDYNTVMKSWAVSGEQSAAAFRIEQILIYMQDMYASGDQDVQPNSESFQIAIEAWTQATESDSKALARAQQILDWMTKLYLSSANTLAMPHTSCYYAILKSWAASSGGKKLEAPIMAEHLLLQMQHLYTKHGVQTARPDTKCFNTVLSSWLKSRDISAEKRIRQIFEYMDDCRRRGSNDIKPDASTYNIVIASIAPAVKEHIDMGGARRADRILARLERGYLAGDKTLMPDTILYNQVIDYWAKTQSVNGHYLKARDVLDRQISMYESGGVRKCRPDVTGYTSVIGACASTSGSKLERRRSFNLAHETFMECCKAKYTQPNDVTYGLMFKAVGRLLPEKDERDRYAKVLFGLCCDDGCLGEMAYKRMLEAMSDELLIELGISKHYAGLPEEWTCNVANSHPPKKQSNNKR